MSYALSAPSPLVRTLRFALPLCLLLPLSAVHAAQLKVRVEGVRATTGSLQLMLVDSRDGWDGKAKPVRADSRKAAGDTAQFEFADLPTGRYAVMLMHDENDNGQLDTNTIGMPIEGYGFSNNPQTMRKPTWDEANFELPDAGTDILLQLR